MGTGDAWRRRRHGAPVPDAGCFHEMPPLNADPDYIDIEWSNLYGRSSDRRTRLPTPPTTPRTPPSP
jgi:hypothetical protein